MTQLSKLKQMLPYGDTVTPEVGVWRLDEDGDHFGWLFLLPSMVNFLDDRDHRPYNDVFLLADFTNADIRGDDYTGILTLEWDHQSKNYKGSTIELREFRAALESNL